MILKSVLSSRDHFDLWDPERHKEPEEEVDHNYILSDKIDHELENPENSIEDELNRKATEGHCILPEFMKKD